MKSAGVNVWPLAALAWIGTIFFSSTSIAAELCERAFTAVAAFLFGSLRPDEQSYGLIHLIADKGFHVFLFVVLAILLWKAIPPGKWKTPAVLLFGAFVGSCSEFLQRFFPGRDPAIRDVLINASGVALGVIVIAAIANRRASSSEGSAEAEDETVLAGDR